MTHKGKLRLILLAIVVLALSSMACNIEPGDRQVGNAVMEGYNRIRDTASDVKDAVEGPNLEIETHESPLPALWDIAKDIAEGE